ncbi:MAG TPA: glycosyltransferase family 39 protein [Stellaceae bacterium]|nr:glycosyltransferase family 39 protein [Stellaceae bacterium]
MAATNDIPADALERVRPAPVSRAPSYGVLAAGAIIAITVARLLWLRFQTAGLYPDEAQYWFWSRHLALGYYSKPPLIAWLIALTTAIFGNSEFAVRLAAPLLHAAASGFVFAIGARLFDRRTGFWTGLAYATLPGVSFSAFLISTDAVLLPCWAAALYAFIRAREKNEIGWWIVTGCAVGLGLLAKYAMVYWLLSAFGFVLLRPGERRHLRGLSIALAIAMLFYLPNLWWNWSHHFATYLHTRDNAELGGSLVHPEQLVEFLISQLGVFGPLFFIALLGLFAAPTRFGGPPARLLTAFAWPTLAIVAVVALLSRAQPNWAAPAYVSAIVLVVAAALRRGWRGVLVFSIALHLAAVVFVFGGSEVIASNGLHVPAKLDPLHRLRGWRRLGDEVAAELAAHPGLRLMADDREVLAALIYYVHPHPFDAVAWDPIPGIRNQWDLENNLNRHVGESFLAVTIHNLTDEMRPDFAALTPLKTIDITSGPGGSQTYRLYIARDYRAGRAAR